MAPDTGGSTRKYKRAVLIYNPVAGGNPRKKERQIRKVAAVLTRQVSELEIAPTRGPDQGRELAARAVQKGSSVIFVFGGDGTINEVVNGMAGSRVPLAVLSGGTANVLARSLKMPRSPVRGARAFLNWEPRRIGLGCVTWFNPEQGKRFFLSVAGVGFDGAVIRNLSSKSKRYLGKVAYGLEGLRQWWRRNIVPFEIVVGGNVRRTAFVVLGRAPKYGGGFRITPGSSIFSDKMIATVFRGTRRRDYLKYLAGIVTGLHPNFNDVDVEPVVSLECRVPAVDVASSGEVKEIVEVGVEVDGELVGNLPARIELLPDMLTLLVPPGSG